MVEVQDGLGVSLRLHNLLLTLAGRLDDSALSEAREMVARSRLDEAAELVTGTLIAGRVPLAEAERREVAGVLEASRSDPVLAGQLTAGESTPSHRFTGTNHPDRGIEGALGTALKVLPDLRTVHAVWRNTPAGGAPGALPQLVVLVEMGGEGHPPAAAYRIDAALRRAGIRAVVEVTGPESPPAPYHQAALDLATPVWRAGSAPVPAVPLAPPMAMADSAPPAPAAPSRSGPASIPPAPAAPSRPTPASIPPAPAAVPASVPASASSPASIPPAPAAPSAPPALRAVAPVKDLPPATKRDDASKAPKHEAPKPLAAKPGPPKQAPKAVDGKAGASKEDRGDRRVSTSELSAAEVTQLRKALAEDPEKGRAIVANIQPHDIVELPALDLDDPQLSDRDRQLLRELHEELAERERTDAGKVGASGSDKSSGKASWWDGYSGS